MPVELWHISTNYPSKTKISPTECIPYGEQPSDSVQRTLKPLKTYTIYNVSVIARKENSGVLGYFVNFCITPDKLGEKKLHVIVDDESKGNDRLKVCSNPE